MLILYYPPLRKQLADLMGIGGVLIALWLFRGFVGAHLLADPLPGLGWLCLVLGTGAMLGWLLGHVMLVSWAQVRFTPQTLVIRRPLRSRVLDRLHKLEYRIRPHRLAQREKEQEEQDAQRQQRRRERPRARYYQESFHVEVLYQGRPLEIATIHGADKAERLHRRLGKLDEEMAIGQTGPVGVIR